MGMSKQDRINYQRKEDKIDGIKNTFKQDNSIPVKSISLIKDKTGGAVSDVVNDTTSSVKDDIASLTSKVNNILLALKNLGIVK
jgi:hypothetical protein|tara:strand:+ start:338 stop:589 length:252 start_codon:yes stop_codon:yes gene_type:complete